MLGRYRHKSNWRIPAGTAVFDASRPLHQEHRQRLQALSLRHGRCFNSLEFNTPGFGTFWGRNQTGAVTFARRGRVLTVEGGLLALEEDQPHLLDDLTEFAAANSLQLAFFGLDYREQKLFQSRGFHSAPLGVEPVLPVPHSDPAEAWEGSWCERGQQSLECGELTCEERTVPELLEFLSAETNAGHSGTRRNRRFLARIQSRLRLFDGDGFLSQRIFVARGDDSTGLAGILSCQRVLDGRLWYLDSVCLPPDASAETLPLLLSRAMSSLQREGAYEASFGPLPLGFAHLTPATAESQPARAGEAASDWSSLPFRFRESFLCASPRVSMRTLFAYLARQRRRLADWQRTARRSLRPTPQRPENRGKARLALPNPAEVVGKALLKLQGLPRLRLLAAYSSPWQTEYHPAREEFTYEIDAWERLH